MKWNDFKKAVLAKIFSSKNGTINENSKNNKDYTIMMPGAFNEGLSYVGNAVRWNRKNIEITVEESKKPQAFVISDEAPGFKEIGDFEVYLLDEDDVPNPLDNARIVAGRLIIPAGVSGTVVFYYDAEYSQIKAEPSDEQYLDVPADILAIMPLYVASQIYMEDNATIALNWRTQFETALNGLKPNMAQDEGGEFYSESGW